MIRTVIHKTLLFFIIILCFSCKEHSKKDLIDGDDYKFWFNTNGGRLLLEYFGSDGRYVLFNKNPEYYGFYEYGTKRYEDDIPPNKWVYAGDSINYWGHMHKIVFIDEEMMVLRFGNENDTLFAAPKEMIPDHINHKWKREIHKVYNVTTGKIEYE